MIKEKRYKLRLNSIEKIEELLQELYNEACKNIEEIQTQMNKISNSVQLNDEILDAKAKYAKAMNDFIVNKDKAIGRKLEIAKLMGEIYKYNGNVERAVNEGGIMDSISLDDLKKALAEDDNNDMTKAKEYNIKIGDGRH